MDTNKIMNRCFPRSVRIACRGATLAFCAWWLVATSAPVVPARDCFKGVASQAKVKVVVGSVKSIADQLPSCGGVDGLLPGATMTLTLSQGARPQRTSGGCYRYETTALEGLDGVMIASANMGHGGPDAFTIVEGAAFSAPIMPECSGGWYMVLRPALLVSGEPLFSPFDAGPEHPWIIERQMTVAKAEACGGNLAGTGEVTCEDQFNVESITEGTP
jgi:hypothetical protein